MHFSARQVQVLRDQRQAGLRHMAERLLNGVENGQKRPFHPLMRVENLLDPRDDGGIILHG